MPSFDGTGPKGQGAMTGRKRGRCWNNQICAGEKQPVQTTETMGTLYGVGRGGRPRGGGQGNCYGGGNRRGQGRRFANY